LIRSMVKRRWLGSRARVQTPGATNRARRRLSANAGPSRGDQRPRTSSGRGAGCCSAFCCRGFADCERRARYCVSFAGTRPSHPRLLTSRGGLVTMGRVPIRRAHSHAGRSNGPSAALPGSLASFAPEGPGSSALTVARTASRAGSACRQRSGLRRAARRAEV
jgi:hypothetical protein